MDSATMTNSLFIMKKRPKQQRAKATVDAIIEAATQLLLEVGYTAVTTNHIAERAGVSIGSLYEYFPAKESIYAELKSRRLFGWFHELIAEPRPTEPQAIIRHLVQGQIAFCYADLKLFMALETQVPKALDMDTNERIFSQFKQLSTAWFAQHGNRVRPQVDAAFLSEFLMHTVSSLVYSFVIRAGEQLDQALLTEEIITLLERYLLKDI